MRESEQKIRKKRRGKGRMKNGGKKKEADLLFFLYGMKKSAEDFLRGRANDRQMITP